MRIHIVQKGDTLEKIADKYNVTSEELRRVNFGLSSGALERGSKVKIPSEQVPIGRGEKAKMPFMMPGSKKEQPKKKEMPKKEMPAVPVQEIPVPAPPPPPPKPAPIPAPPKAAPIIPKAAPIIAKAAPIIAKAAPIILKAEPKMAPKAEHKMPMKAEPIMPLKPAPAKKDMPFNPLLPKKDYKESSMKSPKPLAPMSHKDFAAFMESSSSSHMKWGHHHEPIHYKEPQMNYVPPAYLSPGLVHGKDEFGMGKQHKHPFLGEESSSVMNQMYSGVPPMFEQPQGYTAPVYGGAGAGMPPFSAMPYQGQGQQAGSYPQVHPGGSQMGMGAPGSGQMGYSSMPQTGMQQQPMASQHGMMLSQDQQQNPYATFMPMQSQPMGQGMQGQPYGGQQMGQGMQGQPYGGQPMSQGMQGQPYGGQPMSQGMQGQPYGSQTMSQGMQGQPYGGQPMSQGMQGQPYGGQPMSQGMQGQPYGGQQMGQGMQGQQMYGEYPPGQVSQGYGDMSGGQGSYGVNPPAQQGQMGQMQGMPNPYSQAQYRDGSLDSQDQDEE
ncbi:LysM peptidoglycan-binding domain-containing protein [Fictibacillus sp. KU28468]|uniref:LysM peptidoglycan-binding domain-containing protein n=1 Tax=Fictibacillus sp. KU28468 TaxID=2991053 RepID=UPI00223E023E|nr:LysM peptidoglycan-binding domain-containing protein [Fictibacillus sp. KU28468]UZJ80444.1 LysM peptidoglycan-binding domain-containing protein [Fictibacillus sp. KU28468]